MAEVTTDLVWKELNKQLFAVLGAVSAKGEARTAGIVYVVRNQRLYIASLKSAWKVRHIEQNPNVSLTVPIHKSILFLPWIKIPSATITFAGTATIHDAEHVDASIVQALFRGLETNADTSQPYVVIEVEPKGEFVTYGVGVSLMQMRDTNTAGGRAPV